MPTSTRIYLDNAATSYPKPEAVYDAVDDYNRYLGVPVGRGAYRQAVELQAIVERARKRAADLLGAESVERIIFTFNATDALNLALHGLLSAGDHVVTTQIEHNSVLRPLRDLQVSRDVDVSYVPADQAGLIDPADVEAALRPNTKLVAVIHASNVTGTLQPIADVSRTAKQAGALFLVDAAQTAGHLPIDVGQLGIDLLACAGHKGLLGPLGTGLLYVRRGVEERLRSVRQGGTGSNSENDRQPQLLPDKYESGNHNAPGLCGLEAGLAYLQERTVASIRRHEQQLTATFLEGLADLPNLRVYGPPVAEHRVGVVSVNVDGFEPQVLATILDENFEIQTRAGLHCAPGAHKSIGSFANGGTVRFSSGPFTTADDIQAALGALRNVCSNV